MMKNLNEMMKQVQELQGRMYQVQQKLETLAIEGKAGGDLVRVTLNGKGALTGLSIDASLLKPEEKEIVEDLLTAAHGDARRKAEAVMQEKMKNVAGGLPLPPGLKLF